MLGHRMGSVLLRLAATFTAYLVSWFSTYWAFWLLIVEGHAGHPPGPGRVVTENGTGHVALPALIWGGIAALLAALTCSGRFPKNAIKAFAVTLGLICGAVTLKLIWQRNMPEFIHIIVWFCLSPGSIVLGVLAGTLGYRGGRRHVESDHAA